jgi:hypothetical protein
VNGAGAPTEMIVKGVNAAGIALSKKDIMTELDKLSSEGIIYAGGSDDCFLVNE